MTRVQRLVRVSPLRDLNGDGRLDLLSTAERGTSELRWWRNDAP